MPTISRGRRHRRPAIFPKLAFFREQVRGNFFRLAQNPCRRRLSDQRKSLRPELVQRLRGDAFGSVLADLRRADGKADQQPSDGGHHDVVLQQEHLKGAVNDDGDDRR